MKGKKQMNKKQLNRYAYFLVKKTFGSFHFEECLFDGFFSKRQAKKHEEKVFKIIGSKNSDYFQSYAMDYAFDRYAKEPIPEMNENQLRAFQSNPTFKVMNEYVK
jgi:hypothetical protein